MKKKISEKCVGEKPPVGHKYTGETGMGEKSEAAKSVECGLKKCIGETSWVKSIYIWLKNLKSIRKKSVWVKSIYINLKVPWFFLH